MINEILETGGSGYVILAAISALVLNASRGVFGLQGHRSQQRKEFLEMWDSSRTQDDLWLEVAVRHLFGTYLPARVIRLALAQPDTSHGLRDLTELWSLFRFDPESQTVRWMHRRHLTQKRRKTARYALLVGYFSFALMAVFSALIAFEFGPSAAAGWGYSILALALGFLALICLAREETARVAATVGEEWLARINRPAAGNVSTEKGAGSFSSSVK